MMVVNDATRDARVRKEARSAAQAGYPVVIVALRVGDAPEREIWEPDPGIPIEILRVGRPMRGQGNAVTRRLRNYFDLKRIQRAYAITTALVVKPDLIHANDLDALPAAVTVKRLFGTALVYDAHELYEERFVGRGLVDFVMVTLQKLIFRLWEARLIRHADAMVTVSPLMAEEFARKYDMPAPEVVLNGPQSVLSPPSPVHTPVRIFFQGAFGENRGLVPLVQGMGRLRGRAVLSLQGFGGVERKLRSIVADEGLEDVVRFIEPCPPDRVVECGWEHDVGVISYPLTTKNLALTTPNKVMDYLGAGLAIASVRAPGITRVLDIDACGVTFDASDSNDMFTALSELVAEPERIAQMKSVSIEAAPQYVWEKQARVLLNTYERALRRSGNRWATES